MDLNEKDLEVLNAKGISQEKLAEELTMLAEGFPILRLKLRQLPDMAYSYLTISLKRKRPLSGTNISPKVAKFSRWFPQAVPPRECLKTFSPLSMARKISRIMIS